MTTRPAHGAPAPDQALRAAPIDHARDRRGSPVPTAGMIATRVMELRKRHGLMIALGVMNIGFPAVFLLIRLLGHAFAPYANPPAGGDQIFVPLAAGFLPTFAFIAAAAVGCTAGSRDLTDGMFRHLVVTGRSRLALYLARIPAGLAIIVPLVAIGYTILCAVCVFAAPAFIDDNNVNIPPGLSRAGFESWARDHAEPVICSPGYSGPVPGNVACAGWSKSAIPPAQPMPAAVEALAIKIAKNDYPGYTAIARYPPISLMIKAGLWLELEAAIAFTVGLGLASLMGQRTVPVILLIVFQIILTPILSSISIPHLQDLQRSLVGLAMAHLEPSGLAMAAALPGITGGVGRPGAAQSPLPESTTQAACVILAWLACWTILGAWRMMTRES
jgi:hypothetical protein